MKIGINNNPWSLVCRPAVVLTLAAVACLLPGRQVAAQIPNYRFVTISHPKATNADDTEFRGMNASRSITGMYIDAKKVSHAFVYTIDGGAFTDYDHPNAGTAPKQGTRSLAINNIGKQVGIYTDKNGVEHPYVYDSVTSQVWSYELPKCETFRSVYINDSGIVVGDFIDTQHSVRGYLFNTASKTLTVLNHPKATNKQEEDTEPLHDQGTYITGINNAGMVIGHYTNSDHLICGFVYDSKTKKYFSIDPPGSYPDYGAGTQPTSISETGSVVGSFRDKDARDIGFVYDCATRKVTTFVILNPLGYPKSDHTVPQSINNKRLVVGHSFVLIAKTFEFEYGSFVYDLATGKSIVLDHPDYPTSTFLTKINDNGIIIGYGVGKQDVNKRNFLGVPIQK